MENREKIEFRGHQLDRAPLPEDTFKMALKEFSIGKSKRGDDMAKLVFEIKGNVDEKGTLIFENWLLEFSGELKNPKFNPATIGRTNLDKFLKSVGCENGLEDLDEDISRVSDFVDDPFLGTLKLQKEPYTNPTTGKTYWNSSIKHFGAK